MPSYPCREQFTPEWRLLVGLHSLIFLLVRYFGAENATGSEAYDDALTLVISSHMDSTQILYRP
jgi:hypothetical protein